MNIMKCGFLKGREFLYKLSNYRHLEKEFSWFVSWLVEQTMTIQVNVD